MFSEKTNNSSSSEDSPCSPRSNIVFFAAAAVFFASFALQLWHHAVRTSATFDEPAHVLAGHRYWQCGDYGINPEHPPLLKLLAAAPLASRALVEPEWECGSRLTPKIEMFNAGSAFLVKNGVDTILLPARALSLLVSLLLAILVFLASREMFGRMTALAASALYAFEPNLIAHGSLVTTDMAISAAAFAAAYALYRYGKKPNWARFLLAGAAFGLMLGAKHTALIFVPVLFALFIADAFLFRAPETNLAKQLLWRTAAFAGFFLIGLMMLWAFYGFRYYALPNATQNSIAVEEFIKTNGRPEMLDSVAAKAVLTIGSGRVLPESYVLGLADIIVSGSRNTWIFGQNYATGQWFYFPLAFAVKSSVALIILLPLGLIFPFFNKEKRREMFFTLAPPLAFLAFAMTSKLNIGVRHILPVYAFFAVAAAVGAVWMSRRIRAFRYFVVTLLVFHAVTSVFRVAPNYIAFGNDFFGGTNNTDQIFRDSNVEWGQNYKLINDYLSREKVTDCWFAGFGDLELRRVSQPCRLMPESALRSTLPMDEPVPPVIEGVVLVSVANLPPRGGNEYLPIARTEPIAKIGGSVFVYRGRFEIPLAAALSRAARASQFVRLNRFDEAVDEGRMAVELAPSDPRPHLSLGSALARAGRTDEARRELELAIETGKSDPALFRITEIRARQELGRLK